MTKIKIKKLYLDSVLPFKGSKDAACYDVVAREIIINNNLATIKLGFATEIPKGYKGIIVPRSSFTQKGWIIQNSPAQIDSDYRGEWMIKFQAIPTNTSVRPISNGSFLRYSNFPYEIGERCAQIYFEKETKIDFEEVENLNTTLRNEGGFGSTGK
jgi:dUTP pyrophosphatase